MFTSIKKKKTKHVSFSKPLSLSLQKYFNKKQAVFFYGVNFTHSKTVGGLTQLESDFTAALEDGNRV